MDVSVLSTLEVNLYFASSTVKVFLFTSNRTTLFPLPSCPTRFYIKFVFSGGASGAR